MDAESNPSEPFTRAVAAEMPWAGRCPITYAPLGKREDLYATAGLRALHPDLKRLAPLPFSPDALRMEAARRAAKMSIGGAQPKVSAVLDLEAGAFELVTTGGRYILKPDVVEYPELPANEDVSMRMARAAGLEVPFHALLIAGGGSLCYVIRRFDRDGALGKLAVEDFGQLSGRARAAKYTATMEDLPDVIDQFCSVPLIEKEALFRLTVVSFLLGNEDLHVKNVSVLTRSDGRRTLAPVYDVLNTTLAGFKAEELALSLGGRKSGFDAQDFVQGYGADVLRLPGAVVDRVFDEIERAQPEWDRLLERSFLSAEMRTAFSEVLAERRERLVMPPPGPDDE